MPKLVAVYAMAKRFGRLPYEIKQLPFTEWKEMIQMVKLQDEIL